MTPRIYCGEGTECSPECPAYDSMNYGTTHCKIINKILEVQKEKIEAIRKGQNEATCPHCKTVHRIRWIPKLEEKHRRQSISKGWIPNLIGE